MMTLYFTSGCHLCDHAEALLLKANITYQKVDIMSDKKLIDLYSCTIPVLERAIKSNQAKLLCWPFSLVQLQNFKRDTCHY